MDRQNVEAKMERKHGRGLLYLEEPFRNFCLEMTYYCVKQFLLELLLQWGIQQRRTVPEAEIVLSFSIADRNVDSVERLDRARRNDRGRRRNDNKTLLQMLDFLLMIL